MKKVVAVVGLLLCLIVTEASACGGLGVFRGGLFRGRPVLRAVTAPVRLVRRVGQRRPLRRIVQRRPLRRAVGFVIGIRR
jgi:hypothetical protein